MRRHAFTRASLAAAAFALCAGALAAQRADPAPRADTYVGRLEVLALVESANARILASRSSTLALETWCRDHQLAAEPAIVAILDRTTRPPEPEQLARLHVRAQDEVKYRHVRLRCGDRVLAEADNWYVPSRLTPEMNRLLDTTDTPFGTAVRPLEPYRQTLAVTMSWSALPAGWDRGAKPPERPGQALEIPQTLFEHRAVLFTKEHQPFSEVREHYLRDLLPFGRTPGP